MEQVQRTKNEKGRHGVSGGGLVKGGRTGLGSIHGTNRSTAAAKVRDRKRQKQQKEARRTNIRNKEHRLAMEEAVLQRAQVEGVAVKANGLETGLETRTPLKEEEVAEADINVRRQG
ncbi:unnamed protein product, partial [Choristocarpus tenellus]